MATASQVGAEIAATMRRCAAAVPAATAEAMAAAKVTAQLSMDSARKRGPGLSGMSPISTKVDQFRPTAVIVVPKGPWGMLQQGAKGHPLTAVNPLTGFSLSRPAGGGRFRRGLFNHPGTAALGLWTAGKTETLTAVAPDVERIVFDKVEGAFNG